MSDPTVSSSDSLQQPGAADNHSKPQDTLEPNAEANAGTFAYVSKHLFKL